jgi:uncharacterized membrane protein
MPCVRVKLSKNNFLQMINLWLHILALIVYLGAILGLLFVLLPSLPTVNNHESRVRLLARGLKVYNPLHIGALGLILFTGAFQLTELKAAYRELFARQVGYALGVKLFFAFFLVIFSVYQSMGIAHRFTRRQEAGESVSPQELHSVIYRLKVVGGCIIVLAAITVWLGFDLGLKLGQSW